jgi:D-3-phosphoglycerate dehydrogenase
MVHEPLNFVNTPALARDRGLRVETAKTFESPDYTNLVIIRLESEAGESVVSGTLAGPRHQPRLIGAMGFDMDVEPEKHMLFIRNEDVPGMIGKVGSTLGEYGINIGNMAVGRGEPGSRAAMAVTVDEPVSQEVIDKLLSITGFLDARPVTLQEMP